jgi:hypothetical protein
MATALVAGAASLSSAQWNQNQNRGELFEWSGSVDREVQIVMQGNRIHTNNIGYTESGRYNARPMAALPRQDGQVVVQVVSGRGDVDVIQQPNAQNGYSTTVRIRDPRSGSDRYQVVAYYEGYGYTGNNGVYSNGDIYGNNGQRRSEERSHGRRGDEMRRRDRDHDDDDDQGNRGGVYGNNPVNGNRGPIYGNTGNGGYGNSVLHWTGNVDDLLEIHLQNGRLDYRTLRGNQPTGIRVNDVGAQMPTNGSLTVMQHQGRGSVSIVQQPSAWNGYTAVLRVNDPQSGYGFYDFDLVWR